MSGSAQRSAKTTSSTRQSDRFSAEERAAMKERARELKAGRRPGNPDGEANLLAKIAEMPDADRAVAERVHAIVRASAPALTCRTWYGMPAYANADGKVVVFFQDSGKFKYRYSTLGFQEAANLDDGDMWPVSYALRKWSAVVEKKVAELVKAAVS